MFANLNPFSLAQLGDQLEYFAFPLLFHMVLNCAVTGRVTLQRVLRDLDRQDQFTALTPLIGQSDRLLSVEIDPLLQIGRLIEVEPLISTLLANAGVRPQASA